MVKWHSTVFFTVIEIAGYKEKDGQMVGVYIRDYRMAAMAHNNRKDTDSSHQIPELGTG